MKIFMTLIAMCVAGTVMASEYENITQGNEVVVQVNGQLQTFEVSDEIFESIISSNDSFYYCKNVGDGYRRCSRRNGKCFGATFKLKSICESFLDGAPGSRNR